jgi:amino acid transporter
VLGLAILWTYFDAAVLHRDEPMEYWAERERRTRPKIMLATQLIAAGALIAFVLALALDAPAVAGAVAAPAGIAGFIAVANWTGGIQPLFPER